MKTVGILVLVCGALALVLGFAMDTTVSTDFGERRVHNIGLMNEKQNTILLGAALAIVGALFLGFAKPKVPSGGSDTNDTRSCPYCAEIIKRQAVLCRFCNREVPADRAAASSPISATGQGIEISGNDDLKYWPHTWKRRPK